MYNSISKMLLVARSKSNLKIEGGAEGEPLKASPSGLFSAPENQETYAYAKSAAALMAYLGFKQPNKRRLANLIPKDRAAWLELLCNLVLKKTSIQYLSDKELKKVIIRARPNLGGPKTPYKKDPDAPICIDWTVEQVLEWLKESGFDHLIETFKHNQISGRRLISVDCSALNQMGLKNLEEMRTITAAIRALLDIPRPNALRALMRIPAYEAYLKKRIRTGKTYDLLTFAKYCKEQGFNYGYLRTNKNGNIPCTCEVRVVPAGVTDEEDDDGEESDEGERSLQNAPSVEFTVRNLILRDQTVSALIEAIMESVFCEDPEQRQYGKPLAKAFEEELDSVTGGMTREERLAFTAEVIDALMDELRRTAEVLKDIEELKKHIKEEVTPDRVKELRECADIVLETVMPIAGLVALGDLTLESIFRTDPELEQLVEEVVAEAEEVTNSLVPEALAFVDSVLRLAMERLGEMDIPYLSASQLDYAKGYVKESLSGIEKLSTQIEYKGFDNDTGMGIQTEDEALEQDDKALIEFFRSGQFPASPPATDGEDDEGEDAGDKPKPSVGGEGHDIQTVGAVHTHGKPRGTLTLHSSDASTIPRSATPPWSGGSQRPDSRKSDGADEGGDTGDLSKGQKGGGTSLKEAGQLRSVEAAPRAVNPGVGPKAREPGLLSHPAASPQPKTHKHPTLLITPDTKQQSQLPRHSKGTTNLQQPPPPPGELGDHQRASNPQHQQQQRTSNPLSTPPTQNPGGDTRSGTKAPPASPHLGPEMQEGLRKSPVAPPPTSVQTNRPLGGLQGSPPQGQQQQQQRPQEQQQPLQKHQQQLPTPGQQQQPSSRNLQLPPSEGQPQGPPTASAKKPQEAPSSHKVAFPQDQTKLSDVPNNKTPEKQSAFKNKRSLAGVVPNQQPAKLHRAPSNQDLDDNSLKVGKKPGGLEMRRTASPNNLRNTVAAMQLRKTASPYNLRNTVVSQNLLGLGPPAQKGLHSEKLQDEGAAYREKAFKLLADAPKHPANIEASMRQAEKGRFAERSEDVAQKLKEDEEQAQNVIRKKIWDDLHSQQGGTKVIHNTDDEAAEKKIISTESQRHIAGGVAATTAPKNVGDSKDKRPSFELHQQKGPKRELQQIRNVLVKRRQIVEEWAKDSEDSGSNMTEEEDARLLRITADGIVSDILQLALTNMLHQAEAGKDTNRIMNALKQIKAPVEEKQHDEHDVLLWEPHLPGPGGPKKGGLRKEVTTVTKKKVQVVEEDKPKRKSQSKSTKNDSDDDGKEVTRL